MKKIFLLFICLMGALPFKIKAQEPYWEYSGLKNLRLASLVTHQDGTVFAGTIKGIYYSRDNGKTWELSGAPNSIVYSLAINNQGHIFGGTIGGKLEDSGLWRSLDTGKTWTQYLDGLLDVFGQPININGIACKENGLMFIANESLGFLRSYDNGSTWINPMKWDVLPTLDIIVGREKELLLMSMFTIFRSYDDGDNWEDLRPTKADTSNPWAVYSNVSVSPKGYLYAGSGFVGLLRSKDNGNSWKRLKSMFNPWGGTDSLEYVKKMVFAKDGATYAMADGRGIFRSYDDGDTWQNFWSGIVPQDSLQAMELLAMCQDSAGYLYATTSKGIYRTRVMYVSVGENSGKLLKSEIELYPNPTSENITILFPENFSFKTTKLTLREITGREIFLKEIDAFKDSYTFSIQEIPTGVFLLEVRSGDEVFTKQVSVIR